MWWVIALINARRPMWKVVNTEARPLNAFLAQEFYLTAALRKLIGIYQLLVQWPGNFWSHSPLIGLTKLLRSRIEPSYLRTFQVSATGQKILISSIQLISTYDVLWHGLRKSWIYWNFWNYQSLSFKFDKDSTRFTVYLVALLTLLSSSICSPFFTTLRSLLTLTSIFPVICWLWTVYRESLEKKRVFQT